MQSQRAKASSATSSTRYVSLACQYTYPLMLTSDCTFHGRIFTASMCSRLTENDVCFFRWTLQGEDAVEDTKNSVKHAVGSGKNEASRKANEASNKVRKLPFVLSCCHHQLLA